MTVSYQGEKDEARKGTNKNGVRTYTRVFKLETTLKTEGPYAVGSNANLPVLGSVHPEDSLAWVREIDIECVKGWKFWEARYLYSNEVQQRNENPEADEILISFDTESYQEPVYFDVNNLAVVNSVGDVFLDPPLMRDVVELVARIKANVLAVPTWLLNYQNAVNLNPINISGLPVPAGLAKTSRFTISERKLRDVIYYHELSFEVHIKREGWRSQPLNVGFRAKDDEGDIVEIVNDKDKERITEPVPLDLQGKIIKNPTPSNVFFGNFQVYPELNLAVLPGIS